MPFDKVLVINADATETACIARLTEEFDAGIRVLDLGDDIDAVAAALVDSDGLRLIVLRMSTALGRGDQVIKRLRAAMGQPVPLLVLIPAELTSRLRQYLRVGADDYWVLPLDSVAFGSRLMVMLEWGRTMMRSTSGGAAAGASSTRQSVSLRHRFGLWLRSLFAAEVDGAGGALVENATVIGGTWEKERRLGFGSFGEAWLVRSRHSGEQAVAKIPHDQKLNTKFLQEGAILKRLAQHPNAVKLIEVVKEGRKVILIQEYVAGSTLQELIDQGMEGVNKESLFLQLLDVMACAHREHIMHRDIKPENIIITASGVLKLLDFGTGKDLVKRSISSTVVGSRPYMAPEQIMGGSRVASDVWALGVLLYALATECLPFYADNEKELMDLILEVEPEPARGLEPALPAALNEIIMKCLVKHWPDRYPDAGALKDALLKAFPEFGKGGILP